MLPSVNGQQKTKPYKINIRHQCVFIYLFPIPAQIKWKEHTGDNNTPKQTMLRKKEIREKIH